MNDDWFEFEGPCAPERRAEIVPQEETGLVRDLPHDKWLEKKQRQLFSDAAGILEAAMAFAQIDPAHDKPPDQWVILYGAEPALVRWRVARAAWLSAKEAPVGIKVAKEIAVGISKSIATEKGGPKILNAQFVMVQRSARAPGLYPEQDVDT